jgi:DNA-binding NarL/FixJ family response regulator
MPDMISDVESLTSPGQPARQVRVLLVEDHALVRRGFRRILEDDPMILVVGETSNGEEAVYLVRQLQPDVVIMDCALPGISGLVATSQIQENSTHTAVLMLSMHSEGTWVRKAIKAGARGYVLKNAADLDLVSAVKRVAAGETVLDPQLALPAALKGERSYGLTRRELQILQLIVDGKSNKEIAYDLELSPNTVGVHRANMMQALRIHNTAGLVAYAIRNGLVNPL